ncbi:MAG: DinB family protein [Thermoplasmata archaeon]|nr:DinB family protein [Thermoplasmata archaeon]
MSPANSPVTVETARRLSAYNATVFGRYVRSARRLPWRVATRDRGTGHRSVFQTLGHIMNVHEVWMIYVAQGRTGELESLFRETSRKPTTWGDFELYARKVWQGIDRYMATLTPSKLSVHVRAPWMPGRYTVGDAVLQTSFEQAHHLGEIIGIYWQRDKEPPKMSWIDVNRR